MVTSIRCVPPPPAHMHHRHILLPLQCAAALWSPSSAHLHWLLTRFGALVPTGVPDRGSFLAVHVAMSLHLLVRPAPGNSASLQQSLRQVADRSLPTNRKHV